MHLSIAQQLCIWTVITSVKKILRRFPSIIALTHILQIKNIKILVFFNVWYNCFFKVLVVSKAIIRNGWGVKDLLDMFMRVLDLLTSQGGLLLEKDCQKKTKNQRFSRCATIQYFVWGRHQSNEFRLWFDLLIMRPIQSGQC